MREYIIVIAGAALLSVFADMISPKEWQKYIKLVTGLVIISVIISPLAKIKNVDLFKNLSTESVVMPETEDNSRALVREELQRRIASDVQERIRQSCGREARVEACVRVNDEELIERVELIRIYMDNPPGGLCKELAYIYGVTEDEVIING